MKKSLWYISKYFAPQTTTSFGGRGHSLMKELSKLGYEITVLTSDSNNLSEIPSFTEHQFTIDQFGYKLIYLKTLKYSVAKSAKRILSWVHFEWNLFRFDFKSLRKPDVVIVSSLSLLTIFYGLYLKFKFNCKLVFEVRDIWPLTITEEGGFSQRNPFVYILSLIEKLAYRRSDCIVGTMPNLKAHVATITKNHPAVECIPMGIDLDTEQESLEVPTQFKETYLDRNYFNVVYAGTIGITNALEPFFETARTLQTERDLRFIVIGDGALRAEFMEKHKLPNLFFAPKIPRNMVQNALEQADLLYFSTHNSRVWDYGLSLNKMIDYMKAGKPIVASYSGFPSMIDEAGCGEFVPAYNTQALCVAIMKYKSMLPEQREQLGARGKKWIYENRSYRKLAESYNNILSNL